MAGAVKSAANLNKISESCENEGRFVAALEIYDHALVQVMEATAGMESNYTMSKLN